MFAFERIRTDKRLRSVNNRRRSSKAATQACRRFRNDRIAGRSGQSNNGFGKSVVHPLEVTGVDQTAWASAQLLGDARPCDR